MRTGSNRAPNGSSWFACLSGAMETVRRKVQAYLKRNSKELKKARRQLAGTPVLTPALLTQALLIWASTNGTLGLDTEYIFAKQKTLKDHQDAVRERVLDKWTALSDVAAKFRFEMARARQGRTEVWGLPNVGLKNTACIIGCTLKTWPRESRPCMVSCCRRVNA